MTHRLATNYAKIYCNRTPIVKVIVENVVTCFLGHGVIIFKTLSWRALTKLPLSIIYLLYHFVIRLFIFVYFICI